MPIGDVWRVDAIGIIQAVGGPTPPFSSDWVLVWHIRTTAGVGTDLVEGSEAVEYVFDKLFISGGNDLFGQGVTLRAVRAIRVSDGFTRSQIFNEDLGDDTQDCLPPQCCVMVTGRSGALGRRTTKYAPGVGNDNLGTFGQLKLTDAVVLMTAWFESAGLATFTFESVIFDDDGVLPTITVTRARVSPGFRTQRRRVLDAINEVKTFYSPIT